MTHLLEIPSSQALCAQVGGRLNSVIPKYTHIKYLNKKTCQAWPESNLELIGMFLGNKQPNKSFMH